MANQQQQPSGANTAPPAYRTFERSVSCPNDAASSQPQPRAIQFDASGAGGGGYGSTYGGYGNTPRSASANPYHQKSKPSSGFGCKHVLLSVLTVAFCVLTGTTMYFRSVMMSAELSLRTAKENLERKNREEEESQRQTGGRFAQSRGTSGERGSPERRKQAAERRNNSKIKALEAAKNAGESTKSLAEKARLESDIARLERETSDAKNSHGDGLAKKAELQITLDGLQGKKQDLLKTIDHTKYMLENAVEETAKYKAMVDGLDEVEEYMKKREGALWSRIGVLENKIARASWREAEEWFGPGPHRVEIELEYSKVQATNPDSSSWPRIQNKFTVEMAPLDLMPHAVNLFLQQVHHGLWEKCAIVNGPRHIFQIGPSYGEEDKPGDLDTNGDKGGDEGGAATDVPREGEDPRDDPTNPHYDHFRAKGLDKVSFQEYSDQYPHQQWTVGIAGRPGGPDFYVNKLDNSLIHGPGGQTNQHDLHNEADPCFGKVVEGLDTLKEVDAIPTDPDRGFAMKYPVVIVNARVMVPKENPAEGWREVERGRKMEQEDGIMPLPEIPHGV